jgi:hypothetical protein
MPKSAHTSRIAKSKRVELERRLTEIRRQETTIRERIYKLEASIVAAPHAESGRRLRLWNTVPAEESLLPSGRRPRTRYQIQIVNRARSRQALTALFLIGVAVILGLWLSWQIRTYGLF